MRATATVLMIGRLEYALSPFEDVAALKRALLEAARAGSGMVNFRANGDVEVHALITPGVTVVIEEREIELHDRPHRIESEEEPGPITDFDMF